MGFIKYFASCLVVLCSLLVSCSSLGNSGEVPDWIFTTPSENSSVIYVVGGPGQTLKQAQQDALSKMSSMISTRVSSEDSSYSKSIVEAIQTEITREVQDRFFSSSTAASDSLVSGISETERWQDTKSGNWWSLMIIDKDDFSSSIRQSSQEYERRNRLVKQYSLEATRIIVASLERNEGLSIAEQLQNLVGILKLTNQYEYSSNLSGMVDGVERLLVDYLTQQIIKTSALIAIQPLIDTSSFERKESYEFMVKVNSDANPGVLPWNVHDSNGNEIASFTTDEKGFGTISKTAISMQNNDTPLFITLDLSDLGLLNIVKNSPGCSITLVNLEKYLCMAFSSNITNEQIVSLLEVVSHSVDVPIVLSEESFPRLVFNINYNLRSNNVSEYLTAQRVSLQCLLLKADGSICAFDSEECVGYGENEEAARDAAFQKLLDSLPKGKSGFEKFVKDGLR